jgi:hypothetical protein
MSNLRLNAKQCFDIANLCISYLDEKFSAEGGLFRTSVSLTDVRVLRKQALEFQDESFREDTDPHLVAELLQNALREMPTSLLHDVYQNILETGEEIRREEARAANH